MEKVTNPLEGVEDRNVFVAFGAAWCGPWVLLQNTLQEIEKLGVEVIKIDVDEHPKLSTSYAVVSLPTFIIIRKGGEARRKLGSISPKELIEFAKESL